MFVRLGKECAVRVALIAFGLLIGVFVTELLLRLILPPPQTVRVSSNSQYKLRLATENSDPQKLHLRQSVLDGGTLYFPTATGYRLRAQSEAVIEDHHCGGQTVTVRTNALGHRGPDLREKILPRVLFIGDSITIQDYLNDEDTWVRKVEQLSATNSRPFVAINAGVGAIGMANELAILRETGLRVAPDIVVLGWYLNDFQASPGVQILDVPRHVRSLRLLQLAHSVLARFFPERYRIEEQIVTSDTVRQWYADAERHFPPTTGDFKSNKHAFNELLLRSFYDWGTAWSPRAWEYLVPQFEEFKRLSLMHNIKPLIVIFPVMPQIEAEYLYDYPQQRVRAIGERLGIPVLDLLPVLRETYRAHPNELLYYDQCHPTAFGSSVVAEQVYRFVEKELP